MVHPPQINELSVFDFADLFVRKPYAERVEVPLKNCNSLRNWAVAFFIGGLGNEKATVLFSATCVGSNNSNKSVQKYEIYHH